MSIPVYINVRNRYTTTRLLTEQVVRLPSAVPILIDNASDWPPLLDWYATCPFEVVYLGENAGHQAPWKRVIPFGAGFERRYGGRRYVVTDCDLDIAACPADVLDVLQEPLNWNRGVVKSGLSLRIDDLPEWQFAAVRWETQFWRTPIEGGRFYDAMVDTTFAMYDCHSPHSRAMVVPGTKAVRSAPPYWARHMPWYLDGDNLDDENRHYFRTSNASNSWKPVGRGACAPLSR